MTKKYDWTKLPEGVRVCGGQTVITDGAYNYATLTGSLACLPSTPDDPNAAAIAYARLVAAAKACEVTWRSEWQEATGCGIRGADGASLSVAALAELATHGG